MKKKLSVVIVTALFIFSVVGNVFAWTSFQNSNYLNNGLIDDGLTYPTATPSVTVYTDLTRAGWSGIECAPVVQVENNVPYAYVLHSATGGAKVAKINLTSPGTVPAGWVQDGIQVNTSTAFQMSTPIIVGDNLYCAGNVFANTLQNSEFDVYESGVFTGWSTNPGTGVTVSQSTITLTDPDTTTKKALRATAAGAGSYTIDVVQSGFILDSTQLNDLSITGGIQFSDVSAVTVRVYVNDNTTAKKVFVYNTTETGAIDLIEDYGNYCWNQDITASNTSTTYKVTIEFTTTAAGGYVDLDYAEIYQQSSGIGKITGISSGNTVSYTGMMTGIQGQLNTPIASDGSYLYFGNYVPNGNGKYYKVDISTGKHIAYDLTDNNSTYWAGAAICGDYVVFGSEKGVLYVLNKIDMTLKTSVTLTGTPYIRSTVCAVQDGSSYNLYFTSRTNNSGTLWCYNLSSSGVLTEYWSQTSIGYTNSTPTVSGNYVYVGGSAGVFCVNESDGTMVWKTSDDTSLVNVIKGVQASPVVYSVTSGSTVTDYIYVTTNQANGQCYCIKYVQGATVVQTGLNKNPVKAWNTSEATGTLGVTYTLQGVAAGGGYLVFGNDYANLVIMHVQ